MNINLLLHNILDFNGQNTNSLLIETILINSCFFLLFITTIFYWIKFIFVSFPKIEFFDTKKYPNFGLYGLTLTNIIIGVQLCLRWYSSGHFPLSNLYDSLLFLAWGVLLIFIFLEKTIKLDLVGIIISPTVLSIVAFTGFCLPEELQKLKPLVPALQSNWLFMHVTVMIFSYAALIIGSLFATSFILYYYYLNSFSFSLDTNINSKEFSNQNVLNLVDNLSYRLIGVGFCLLTLGILSGAVWANETWGNYWSWDPKETWALITWLVFAMYLHTRLIHGFQGLKSAWIACCGFIVLWVCYLGVNLLGEGLHSYGFLNS